MIHHLFAYGTLLDPHVQRAVIGRAVPGERDALTGFRKTSLQDGADLFPDLAPDTGAHVNGRVLEISEAELALIDRYEGDLYRRQRVQLASGRETWVYRS